MNVLRSYFTFVPDVNTVGVHISKTKMEEPPEPQSPRKRQRLASPIETSKLIDETTGGELGQMASIDAPASLSAADIQLKKEMEVGITEFVSPDLPGFTGILKKRSL